MSDQRDSGPPGPSSQPRPPQRRPVPPASPQAEPELLTHPAQPKAGTGRRSVSGSDRNAHQRGVVPDGMRPYLTAGGERLRSVLDWFNWRRGRKITLVCVLLGILAPVLAIFIGWIFLGVPSSAALAAQRKQVTTIMASDGTTEIGRYVPEDGNRVPVTLAQVPVQVQNAVLAAEDRSFRSNPGFDIAGIGRAAWNQLTGGSGGGSTITQQYIKVATGQDEYSIFRKFREVIVAAKITKQESKDRILQDYLNTIYFGRGAYGIQAASQAYFGKNVQNLDAFQAAVLASAIRSPSVLDPAKNLAQAQARWNFVLDGMVEKGWLSPGERAGARYPDTVPPSQIRGVPTDDRAHIVDQVMDELSRQGISREQMAVEGGKILTTIDPRAQTFARDAAQAELRGQPTNLHTALVAVDPRTGGVIAYYGGSDGNGFDLAGGPVWSPGSAFKPFTMLAALERDIGMNTVYSGDSPVVIDGRAYNNSESLNYPKLTLHEAMTKSVNTAFVRLTQKVGPQAVRDAAIQAGIPEEINGKRAMTEPGTAAPGLGITLGQYPVHTMDMASAYATFADDGMRRAPFFIRKYTNSHGSIEYEHVDKPQQAFDQADTQRNSQLARNVTATLTDVARSSQIPLAGGRQVAAKTGTHQLGETGENAAAWTVGYTPSISTAVWVGDPANTAIKNRNDSDIFGRGVPGLIWQRFMDSYLKGAPMETFPAFKLIGPAAPPPAESTRSQAQRNRDQRNDRNSTTNNRDENNNDGITPDLINPVKPSTRPTRPERNSCFPFCTDPEQDRGSGRDSGSRSESRSGSGSDPGPNSGSGSDSGDGGQDFQGG
ncbi:MAG TPA: transglycosylase domain-containing protein [Pseudonocardiaceae bacterium]